MGLPSAKDTTPRQILRRFRLQATDRVTPPVPAPSACRCRWSCCCLLGGALGCATVAFFFCRCDASAVFVSQRLGARLGPVERDAHLARALDRHTGGKSC